MIDVLEKIDKSRFSINDCLHLYRYSKNNNNPVFIREKILDLMADKHQFLILERDIKVFLGREVNNKLVDSYIPITRKICLTKTLQ